jgi:glycosyltransferase involved in cell wall biosynthesis
MPAGSGASLWKHRPTERHLRDNPGSELRLSTSIRPTPVKILRVISSMDPVHGGPCQGIRNIVPALAALGAHNEVLSFDDPGAAFLGKDDFPIHAIGPAQGPYAYCSALRPWLLANLARFDVVIAHGLWLHNNAGTWRALRRYRRQTGQAGPRFCVMPHGMLDPYFQRAPERRWKALRNTAAWKLFEGAAVNNADAVLFTCAQELLLAREPFSPYRPRRELDVGYGIQAPAPARPAMAEAFAARCPGLGGKPYLLFLSRVHEKKGTDLLLRAYLRLRGEHAGMPALVIAGPGLDSEHGRMLQALAQGQPGVHFPGMLRGDEKWGALYGCEAFVLPSHQENFGIAVVEAMACGRPVLISRQVNIWRECEPGGLVDDDSEDGVARMLARWLAMPLAERAARGQAAHAAYRQNFAADEAARRLLGALQALQAPHAGVPGAAA